jgi:hypothetical protein
MSHSEKWKKRLCYFEIHSAKVLLAERTQFLNREMERLD